MAAISVIILACNDEKWIRNAVDSALRQTLRDIEIVIVDDGSTDSTPAILADYAKRDERVKIVTNESNRGTMYSRWNGIQNASGNYIMFLDSDDTLVVNACEVLSGIMEKEQYDVLMFGTAVIPSDNTVSEDSLRGMSNFLRPPVGPFPKGQGAMLEYVAEEKMSFNVWNKIFRHSILVKAVANYEGDRIQMAEDLMITSMALAYSSSFGSTPQVFYSYTFGSGLSTSREIPHNKIPSFAAEARVYPLLKKWMSATGLKEYVYRNTLLMVKERMENEVLWALFNRTEKKDARFFVEEILRCWTLEEFGEELTDYLFLKKLTNPLDALERLQGCFPVSDGRAIRTVGMYYHRLYNGGVERVMSLLTPILMRAGYNVVLITEVGPTEDDYELPENAKHVQLETPGCDPKERYEEWQKLLKKEKIDLVLYHGWMDDSLVQDSLAIKSAGLPLILHGHNSFSFPYRYPTNPWGSWFSQRLVYALFDTILTLSEPDAIWCRALGMRAIQVNNPLTFSLEENHPAYSTDKRIIWVARLSAEKRYYDAFEIAELVHKAVPEVTLHVVGKTENPEEFAQIMEYINEHKMSEYVLFDGYHEDVRDDYRKASVYLCTSEYEGFVMSFQEAKVFGLPIVSYELPNLTLLRGKDNGTFSVPQLDKKAAADKLIELLSDEKLLHEESIKARKSLEALYAEDPAEIWKRIIEETCTEREEPLPISLQSAESIAIRMAMDNAAFGINNVAPHAWQMEADANWFRGMYDRANNEITALVESNRYFENTIHEIQSSTSFRLGMFLTWPLRKLKDWIKRLRK